MEEFSILSAAWLSHDPNDPSLLTDPNLIDPNDFTGWNPICDMNDDYSVNAGDLLLFCNEWLWQACRSSYQSAMMSMALGMDSMILTQNALTINSQSSPASASPPVYQDVDIEQEYATMIDMIEFLEKIWLEDEQIRKEIKKKDWEEFMDKIYDRFFIVEDSYLLFQKSEDLESIRQ